MIKLSNPKELTNRKFTSKDDTSVLFIKNKYEFKENIIEELYNTI